MNELLEDYIWTTEEQHATNSDTMSDWIDNEKPASWDLLEQDGSYCEIVSEMDGYTLGVHASGNGDSFNHKVSFEIV